MTKARFLRYKVMLDEHYSEKLPNLNEIIGFVVPLLRSYAALLMFAVYCDIAPLGLLIVLF